MPPGVRRAGTFAPRLVRSLLCAGLTLASSTSAAPSWDFLGPVAAGRQFDAVRGPTGNIHVISSRYYELSPSGSAVVDEAQGDERQGALDFPPAIDVESDGAVHIVTRHGGSFQSGHDIRYRRRSPSGTWDVDTLVGSPVPRNYVVGIAAAGSFVTLMSSQVGSNVWGDLHLWSATATPSALGDVTGVWRGDCDARLRSAGGKVFFVSGLSDPDGSAHFSWGSAGSGLAAELMANLTAHVAGTGRRGFPDLQIDASGQVHFVYGAEQEVYYNRYDTQGNAVFPADLKVFDSLGTWHISAGLSAVAGSDDGKLVLVVALESDGSSSASNSELLWSLSTDGGASFSPAASLGRTTDAGEGRARPRLVAIGQQFFLLFNAGSQIELARFTPDLSAPDAGAAGAGGSGAAGSGGTGGAGASGGGPAVGGAGGAGAGGQTSRGSAIAADDSGCGCRVSRRAPSGLASILLLSALLLTRRRSRP